MISLKLARFLKNKSLKIKKWQKFLLNCEFFANRYPVFPLQILSVFQQILCAEILNFLIRSGFFRIL